MNRDDFKEALLSIMEQKTHWSNEAFATGGVPRDKLHIHFEQEYEVFVRDFPILVARAYVKCPFADVRRDLAENIYEEETGGITAGKPHPELFLMIPAGFGCDMRRFDNVALLPGAKKYRDALDRHTLDHGWECAAAATTIFIEGTQFERGELDPNAPKRAMPPLEQHPLHVNYQLPLSALELPRIHRTVEGSHRTAAWRTILDYVDESRRPAVVKTLRECLDGWIAYKDDVARACGLMP